MPERADKASPVQLPFRYTNPLVPASFSCCDTSTRLLRKTWLLLEVPGKESPERHSSGAWHRRSGACPVLRQNGQRNTRTETERKQKGKDLRPEAWWGAFWGTSDSMS